MKHLNGDLRALLLVQSGVKEIHTAPLKVGLDNGMFLLILTNIQEAVTVLKGRVEEQLDALGQVSDLPQIHHKAKVKRAVPVTQVSTIIFRLRRRKVPNHRVKKVERRIEERRRGRRTRRGWRVVSRAGKGEESRRSRRQVERRERAVKRREREAGGVLAVTGIIFLINCILGNSS